MYEIPLSLSIRFLTDSLLIIVPTRAYFPTSLKNVNRPIPPSHERLFTISGAGAAPPSRGTVSSDRNVSSIPLVFLSIVSSLITGRSADLPDGSPTRPVAPPSNATGVCPCRWNHDSTMMPSRLPKCNDSAVGSNPQYTLSDCVDDNVSSSGEVTSWIRPRSRSVSTTFLPPGSSVEDGAEDDEAAAYVLALERPRAPAMPQFV